LGSVSSVSPGMADLMQTLFGANSPLSSSPAMMTALENAPPQDVVALSVATVEMEGVDELFGESSSTTDMSSIFGNSDSLDQELLSGLADPTGNSTSSTSSNTTSLADPLTSYQAALQSAETTALLGTSRSGSTGSGLDTLG
jgi:hypothetical protein